MAIAAGIIGMLSLTTAKSSVLVGVLISVTTIPAAANIGVAAAYPDWATAWGAGRQLLLNLTSIFVAGLLTLLLQRRLYMRRRRQHLSDKSRVPAGLPLGQSRRAAVDPDEEPRPEVSALTSAVSRSRPCARSGSWPSPRSRAGP